MIRYQEWCQGQAKTSLFSIGIFQNYQPQKSWQYIQLSPPMQLRRLSLGNRHRHGIFTGERDSLEDQRVEKEWKLVPHINIF